MKKSKREVLAGVMLACAVGFPGAVALVNREASLPDGVVALPFSETFTSDESLDMFTIIDGDGNGLTWRLDNGVVCNPGNQNTTDDWLITPGFYMEAGKMYTVKFRVYGSSYFEMFEVKYGTSATAEAMSETFVAPRSVEGTTFSPLDYEDVIVPAADGVYYIGFHSVTADRNFFFDNLTVEAPIVMGAPAPVSGLAVEPDQTGLNKATISFTAPMETVGGDPLTSLSGIRVMRGDETVENLTDVEPGGTYTVVDVVPAAGYYTYKVFAFNDEGLSAEVSAALWVGANKPLPVGNLEAWETETDGEVTVYWSIPEADIDGKELDASLVTYRVIEITDGHEVTVAENLAKTSYTYRPELALPQEFKSWAVEAVSAAGTSRRANTSIMAVGTPWTMPFEESFVDGGTSTPFGLQTIDGEAAWDYFIDGKMVRDVFSQDCDGGFAGMRGQDMSSAAIYSGKVKIEGDNPQLSLFVHSFGSTDENEIEIYAQEGDNLTELAAFELSELEARGWNYVTIPLSKFKGRQLQFLFAATVWSYNYTFIDNIRVAEALDCDLNAKLVSVPAEVAPGEEFEIAVTVENLGLKPTGNFAVKLYRDGELLDEQNGSELGSGASVEMKFKDRLSRTSSETVVYRAEVVAEEDGRDENNVSRDATVKLLVPTYPAVTDLTAEMAAGGVTLTWSEPDLSAGMRDAVTETFESASPFSTTVEGWKFVDMDGGGIGGLGVGPNNQTVDIPGIPVQSQQSWWVWDLESLTLQADEQNITAPSGNKFLAQMYNYDSTLACDDWAISPQLSGEAQTISLMARSFQRGYSETFEILYSTGSREPEDFVLVEEKYMIPSEWTLYSFDLPAGAEYFAIRCTSANKFMLFIDDVTFIPAEVNGELTIVGYNVYRDGQRLNDEPLPEPGYVDAEVSNDSHTYHVTTIYDRGESRVSNPATVNSSGIQGVAGDDSKAVVRVVGHDITVTGCNGAEISVYSVDGNRVANERGADDVSISVTPGVYIVKVASDVTKVIVR